MGKIDELIQQYCPDGVEYVNVGDMCDIHKGVQFNKSDMKEMGSYPVMNGGINPSGYAEVFNEDENTITISQGGASAGYVNFLDSKFWLGAHCYALKPYSVVMNRYLYHYIKQSEITLQQCQYGAGIPALAKSTISSLEIPLPPLPVQEAIVNILDRFAVYAAELQAELQARQQQYNYYRDTLLSFEGREDVQWKKLDEVASIKTGRRFVRTDIRESGVPCFHYGDIYTYYGLTATKTKGYLDAELASKLRFAQPNDVVVVCAGENDMDIGVGVAWLGDEPAVIHDACCILHHEQNPRYISHFLRTHNYHLQMKRYVKNGKISSLPASGLAEALIPIPSLEEQEKIANILDRFDTLVNDLSQGLPAEIEARQQQYEYYRDQLLTFKRKEA